MNGVYRVTRHGARGSEKTLEAKLIIQTSAVATSLLSLCAENWKATLEDDKRPTKRKEGRKEKLTRVHRPKNSLRFASTKSLFSLAPNFPRRFFFLTKTHFDDVITNTLVYIREPESDSRYARELC